jgi:hypothetical protein
LNLVLWGWEEFHPFITGKVVALESSGAKGGDNGAEGTCSKDEEVICTGVETWVESDISGCDNELEGEGWDKDMSIVVSGEDKVVTSLWKEDASLWERQDGCW